LEVALVAALLLNALWAALEHMDVSLFTMLLPLSAAAIMPQCVLLMLAAGIGFGFIGSWASLQRSLGHAAEV
jgi:hypothetical protein